VIGQFEFIAHLLEMLFPCTIEPFRTHDITMLKPRCTPICNTNMATRKSLRYTRSHLLSFCCATKRTSFRPQATTSLLPCSSTSLVNININQHVRSQFWNTPAILHTESDLGICHWNSQSYATSTDAKMPSLNDHSKGPLPTEPATEQKQNQPVDFGALRREREKRQQQMSNKRDRSISPPATSRKTPKLESTTLSLPNGAKLTSFSSIVKDDQQTRKSEAAQAANDKLRAPSSAVTQKPDVKDPPHTTTTTHQPVRSGNIRYPQGVVKKTWAFGHERTGNDIKIEEVLESQTLKTAVLSAFQWDMDWLFSKVRVDQTKCIFVMQAKEQSMKDQMLEETKDMRHFLRLCFPSMDGLINCMHSKLMLLFHPNKLRIAIPTANLLNFDWGESGVMENSVWLIDLPRLADKSSTTDDLTDFGKELMYFVGKQGIPQDAIDGVLNFDFSATKDFAFVHTVGGMLYGDEAERTGLPGLAQAVRRHSLTTADPEIDFAASSMGSLKDEFLKNVHAAASGGNMVERAEAATSRAKSSFFQPKTPTANPTHSIRDKIRLYFPTNETVTSSTAGGAGTICLNRKWYEDMSFPRRCFRDYISTRPGLLSHNKILYARGVQKSDGDEQPTTTKKIAWAYVGSANMSESAWGKLVYDRKEKKWKLNCKNWECGVLLPVSTNGAGTEAGNDGIVDMEVFKNVAEPPFMYPGVEYGDSEPWYFMEKH
jgi:hypothetical protein